MIKKKDGKWVVYDSTGEKVLGEHDTEEEAKKQLSAIEAKKHARVNVLTQVNAADIRREMHNGREHIVVPSYTLPDGVVMNGGLYPKEEIDASYKSLEGTFAPFGHPQIDGQYVGASSPDAVNAFHVGAFNRNVERKGHRVYIEKWIDLEYAKNSTNGRKVLEAIDKGEPIHTSTGIFLEREMTPNADGHDWIARNMQFDHDAILINQVGAATPAQGVGMMVNKQLVINSVVPNESALDDSYGEKRDILNAAVRERYATAEQYAYVEDFDDESVLVCTQGKIIKVRYHMEDGNPILGEEVGEVYAKTEYEMKTNQSRLSRIWNMLKFTQQHKPETVQVNEMTPEELQAALKAHGEELQGAFNKALADQAAKHEAELAAVNKQLSANADAQVAAKREVVKAKFGEVVANALSGEALDEMVAKCSVAAPLLGGMPQVNGEQDQWKDYSLNAHMEAK